MVMDVKRSMRCGVDPFYLDSPQGALFCAYHRPAPEAACRGQVLVVAPFNEEMNRCRSMVTLQAQALAAEGVGTLVVDLFGTGDSAGEFRDARWDLWLSNLEQALDWLDRQAGTWRALLGIRLGALAGAEFIARAGRTTGLDLIAWQPVVEGRTHFTQFLRIRLAAQMDRPDLSRESTASLREALASGRNIEVGGYEVSPALAAAIEGAALSRTALPPATSVLWLEQAPPGSDSVPPASRKQIDAWAAAGVRVDARLFEGPAFWQMHERVTAPQAIEKTSAWVGARLAGSEAA